MNRRWFLSVTTAAASWLGASVPAVEAAIAPVPVPARQEAEAWLEVFGRPRSAARIGLTYLDRNPAEADASFLTSCLRNRCTDATTMLAADVETRRQWLAEHVSADFAHGEVVNVGGWILSSTEARLCALAALTEA